MTCQYFIDRVIDDLIDQVVKSSWTDIADIHGGTFPNRFKPF